VRQGKQYLTMKSYSDTTQVSTGSLRYIFQLFILAIVDFIVIRFWLLRIDPDPSVSIGIIFLVPSVFIVNVIISIIVAFIKKEFASLFVINSVIASILVYVLFLQGIDRHQKKRYETWQFSLIDTTFEIRLNKIDTTFNVYYKTTNSYSVGFMEGKYTIKHNEYYLVSDSAQLKISNETLYGFRRVIISLRKP